MRATVRLLAVLILAAAGSAVAQEKHLIDPTPPGSLNPEPLRRCKIRTRLTPRNSPNHPSPPPPLVQGIDAASAAAQTETGADAGRFAPRMQAYRQSAVIGGGLKKAPMSLCVNSCRNRPSASRPFSS